MSLKRICSPPVKAPVHDSLPSPKAKAAAAAKKKAQKEGTPLPEEKETKKKKETLKEKLGFVPRTGPQVFQ